MILDSFAILQLIFYIKKFIHEARILFMAFSRTYFTFNESFYGFFMSKKFCYVCQTVYTAVQSAQHFHPCSYLLIKMTV